MPTFDTPEPISVTVEIGVGDIRIVASDRTDTIVEVRPSNSAKKSDVTAAEQTRVEYSGGRLMIKASKGWRQYTFRGGGESIDVQIDLPAGSHLRGVAAVGALPCTGRPRDCHFKSTARGRRVALTSAVSRRSRSGPAPPLATSRSGVLRHRKRPGELPAPSGDQAGAVAGRPLGWSGVSREAWSAPTVRDPEVRS